MRLLTRGEFDSLSFRLNGFEARQTGFEADANSIGDTSGTLDAAIRDLSGSVDGHFNALITSLPTGSAVDVDLRLTAVSASFVTTITVLSSSINSRISSVSSSLVLRSNVLSGSVDSHFNVLSGSVDSRISSVSSSLVLRSNLLSGSVDSHFNVLSGSVDSALRVLSSSLAGGGGGGGGVSYPDITDDPGVQVTVSATLACVPGAQGIPFYVDTFSRSFAFYVRDDSGFARIGSVVPHRFEGGIGFGSTGGITLVSGDNDDVPVYTSINTCASEDDANISGLVAMNDGPFGFAFVGSQFVVIMNYGPGSVTLLHNSARSTNINRFLLVGGTDLVIPINGSVTLMRFSFPSISPNSQWGVISKTF